MEAGLAAALLAGLAIASAEDIRSRRIPDRISVDLLVLGLVHSHVDSRLAGALVGAAAAFGLFVGIERAYASLCGREGLGRGDAKLFAVAGAWFGWQALPETLLIAASTGLLFALASGRARAGSSLPFGPFLAVGTAANLVL